MGIEKGIMAMMMVVVLAAVVLQIMPVQATPTVYTCPICGEQFTSLAGLEAHFAAAHPSEPIDIIWQ